MTCTPDEIAALPGRQVIAAMREVLQDEDWRIRGSEGAIVAAGLRKQPDPEILSRAERFHALDVALQAAAHAVRSGDSHGGASSVNLSEGNRS